MKTAAILLISIFTFSQAYAKTAGDCHKELKDMCKEKMGKEKFECMRNGADKLDDECKKMITAGKEKFNSGVQGHPCAAEREKCKDAGGGHEKVMKCLLEKRAELSDGCKNHIDDKMKTMPCFEDKIKFCGDIKPGGGRIVNCLKANNDKISQQCKDNMLKSKPEDFDKVD